MDEVKKWYSKVLKIDLNDWNGTVITPQSGNETILSFFTENDSYFPTDQQAMLNFQVHDMDEMMNIWNRLVYRLKRRKRLVNLERLFG